MSNLEAHHLDSTVGCSQARFYITSIGLGMLNWWMEGYTIMSKAVCSPWGLGILSRWLVGYMVKHRWWSLNWG